MCLVSPADFMYVRSSSSVYFRCSGVPLVLVQTASEVDRLCIRICSGAFFRSLLALGHSQKRCSCDTLDPQLSQLPSVGCFLKVATLSGESDRRICCESSDVCPVHLE